MAELNSVPPAEEATEPLAQAEVLARLEGLHRPSTPPNQIVTVAEPDADAFPLDCLQVPDRHIEEGVRIIFRLLSDSSSPSPRASSPVTGDGCRRLALRAEVASAEQPEHQVLAVTQTPQDIKFVLPIPTDNRGDSKIWCELYYDPASDRIVLINRSHIPISLVRVVSVQAPTSPALNEYRELNPSSTRSLIPGTWRIKVRGVSVLDFRILKKKPIKVYDAPLSARPALPSSESSTSMKRSLSQDGEDPELPRRVRHRSSTSQAGGEDTVTFLAPSVDPLVFTLPHGASETNRELSLADANALLAAAPGTTLSIPGSGPVSRYYLSRLDPIAKSSLSAVYEARHSDVGENLITVKVIKTQPASNAVLKPHVHERNVIRQADTWKRESTTQEDLKHVSIVRYYGGDARFLSHYMEHVDAKDLSGWREVNSHIFKGDREDAARILRQIADALRYVHSRDIVHNDIKPGNILYSRDKGAFLCDFGMATPVNSKLPVGGTPYYIPPEFIGMNKRGPPSDVWALGVTMLYVLRKISLPESRANAEPARRLYWLIAGVNNDRPDASQYGNGEPATMQMRQWLQEIRDARATLDRSDIVERTIWYMLAAEPNERATMQDIVRTLQADGQ